MADPEDFRSTLVLTEIRGEHGLMSGSATDRAGPPTEGPARAFHEVRDTGLPLISVEPILDT